jgi:hypothetical protein
MIYIKDNVLSDEDIQKLLVFTTHPPRIWGESYYRFIDSNQHIVQKVKQHVFNDLSTEGHQKKFDEVEYSQVISYPTGSSKGFHIDDASKETTGTSVTFLNDDIIGGEAVVEGVHITPVKGRTYFIDGKMYKHSVLNVIKGTRITLTCWYKRD